MRCLRIDSQYPLSLLVLWVSGWFDRKFNFPMRPVAGIRNEDLKRTLEKDLNQLPPLFQSYLPIVLPVLLISSVSIIKVLYSQGLELELDSFSSEFSVSVETQILQCQLLHLFRFFY